MTRHFFWVAAALALSLPLLTQQNRAVAQEAGASAEADTSDASADTSADANSGSNDQADAQAEASDNSSTQADLQSNASDDSAQADAQATSDGAAQDSTTDPSNETQDASNDLQNTQSYNAHKNQTTQGGTPSLPAPSTQNDPNANQSREKSRVVDGQQYNQQDRATDRNRADASRDWADDSRQGRDNRGDRNRRDRENDFRVGIQFGRATDRGLIINHIDQNSFYYRNGFRRGDLVVSVHGRPVRNDADFMRFFVLEPGQRVPIVVLRDGRRETIYVQYRDVAHTQPGFDNQYRSGGAYLGVLFDPQVRDAAVVLNVNPGSPAQEAGLQAGDILLSLNGQEIRSYPDAISMIRAMRPGDELGIIVERTRGERQIVAVLDSPPSVRTAGRPDVQLERRTIQQYPDQQQIDLNYRYDDGRYDDGRYDDGRLRERDRNYDDSRGRPLLPRFRN